MSDASGDPAAKGDVHSQRTGHLLGALPRPAAVLLLAALVALVGLGLRTPNVAPTEALQGRGDIALYASVAAAVGDGASYYEAMPDALRAGQYPLRPFVTVRPPWLSWLLAALGDAAARALLVVLALFAFAALVWRATPLRAFPALFAVALVGMASGLMPALASAATALHEVWAGVLIALSLALRTPERYWPSIALGLAAALIRELAAAYLLAMVASALWDGLRREAAAWMLALAAFAIALAAHASMVLAVVRPDDPASPSWLSAGGWGFILETASWNALAATGPGWLVALLTPAALIGLAGWRGPWGRRLVLIVVGYWTAFLIVGRPDNLYWGLLIAPLWPLGWVGLWPVVTSAAGVNPASPRRHTSSTAHKPDR